MQLKGVNLDCDHNKQLIRPSRSVVNSVNPTRLSALWLQSLVCSLRRKGLRHLTFYERRCLTSLIEEPRSLSLLPDDTHGDTQPEATFALCDSLGTGLLFWPKCSSFIYGFHKASQTLVINDNYLGTEIVSSILRGSFGAHLDSDCFSATHSCLELPQHSLPGRTFCEWMSLEPFASL